MHPPANFQKKNFPRSFLSPKAKQKKRWIKKKKKLPLNQQMLAPNVFENKSNPVIPKWHMSVRE